MTHTLYADPCLHKLGRAAQWRQCLAHGRHPTALCGQHLANQGHHGCQMKGTGSCDPNNSHKETVTIPITQERKQGPGKGACSCPVNKRWSQNLRNPRRLTPRPMPVSRSPQTGEVPFASILAGHIALGLTGKQRDHSIALGGTAGRGG